MFIFIAGHSFAEGIKAMDEVIMKYLASKILDDIRYGRPLGNDVAESLNRYPIDTLRQLVQKEDVPLLMEMAASSSLSVGNLGITLLRKFDREEEIKSFMLSSWRKASNFERKHHLLWRVLDDENRPRSVHEEMYQFVKDNLQPFIDYASKWYGGKEKVLDTMKMRLADKSFPSTKHWVYLCVVLGSPDTESVVQLLKEYQSSENDFTARVAADMLREVERREA